MDGEIRISRSPVDSRPSFLFSRRRSSGTERSLVGCNDMGQPREVWRPESVIGPPQVITVTTLTSHHHEARLVPSQLCIHSLRLFANWTSRREPIRRPLNFPDERTRDPSHRRASSLRNRVTVRWAELHRELASHGQQGEQGAYPEGATDGTGPAPSSLYDSQTS